MKKRLFRISTLLSLALATASGSSLYLVSQEVHRAEHEMAVLESKINSEKDAIRTLYAEWNYLNNPERLERLAHQYLQMEDPAPEAIMAGARDLPELFVPTLPSRKPDVPESATLQPVQASVPVVPSRLPIPAISPQPAVSKESNDFNALLKSLGDGGRR
jgi:hypothetical protein